MNVTALGSALFALLLGAPAEPPVPAPLSATPSSISAMPFEVAIPNTRQVEFISRVNGHAYALKLAIPMRPPPPKGYRVLYVLDGDNYFGTATEAVRMNGNAPDVLVVGIGYPDTAAFAAQSRARHPAPPQWLSNLDPVTAARILERTYDLTLPASEDVLAGQSVAGLSTSKPSDVGGLDDFLQTIESEVKPRVAAIVPIDRDNQVLFGHSLGGLAVLHALFTGAGHYRSYIAASPSIWWSNSAVLAGEAQFSAGVASGRLAPRLLVTMGADEDLVPKSLMPGIDRNEAAAMLRKYNMVGNARDLSSRLRNLRGAAGYEVADFALFADQDHGHAVWPAMGRAVSFAFSQSAD